MMLRDHPSLRLLRDANYRRFFIGRTASQLGGSMAWLALTFGVLDSGGSAATLGVILGVSTVPQIVLTLLGGVVSDRLERRRVLIGTDAVLGVTQFATGMLFLTGHASLWWLLPLRVMYGAASAFLAPALNGAIVDIVGADSMQEARSFLSLGQSTVRLAGPALGGVIIAASNPGWALVFDALTFAISAAALMGVRVRFAPMTVTNSVRHDFLHGWREFTSRRWAVIMILAFMLYQATVLPAVMVLGPEYAMQTWHGATTWAAVLTAMAFGDVVGGILMLRWRPAALLTASILVWALDVPFLVLLGAGLSNPLPATITASLLGFGLTSGSTLWYQALASEVPSESLSRVTSYDELGSLIFNPLGLAIIGSVAAGIGFRTTFAVIIASHVVSVALLLASRSVRAIRRPAPVAN